MCRGWWQLSGPASQQSRSSVVPATWACTSFKMVARLAVCWFRIALLPAGICLPTISRHVAACINISVLDLAGIATVTLGCAAVLGLNMLAGFGLVDGLRLPADLVGLGLDLGVLGVGLDLLGEEVKASVDCLPHAERLPSTLAFFLGGFRENKDC